jgi:hypothetical protein
LKEELRYIDLDEDTDSAAIIFPTGSLPNLPANPLPLLPVETRLPIGADVGWLGYPGIAAYTLCFFSGIISAPTPHGYLIDGVAINGVSGGPVIAVADGKIQVVGTISAYAPNRATGDTLPGLSVAQDISHFHDSIIKLKSLDEANKRKRAEAQERERAAPEVVPPEPSEGPADIGAVPATARRSRAR